MRWFGLGLFLMLTEVSLCSDVLMVTLGGTKSHKMPFLALAKGLTSRNHSVTFISAFTPDYHMPGLEEINPAGLVFYVRNYTNWDLVGSRMRGEEPVPFSAALRYGYEVCESFYDDPEIKDFMESGRKYDVVILDSAFPDCGLGLVHILKAPFVYLNTIAYYMIKISEAGTPAPYAVTPFFAKPFTDNMNLIDRSVNVMYNLVMSLFLSLSNSKVQQVLYKHVDKDMPNAQELGRNVSFILQNGHYSLTHTRPYLPNVAEVGCMHCKPPKPIEKELEDFINLGGDSGFIFVSLGSSVKTANTPEELRRLFVRTFARLPYQVLWKWDTGGHDMTDIPQNVMISKWLPQQDLLGHKKIRGFVTHSGLLSTLETVYHGVPIVAIPVFCDQDSSAEKASEDGYAIKLDFKGLSADMLYNSIMNIVQNPKFKEVVKHKQSILRDQMETPLERALFWVEYVIRHKGASHFYSPSRNMNVFQYYSIDILALYMVILFFSVLLIRWWVRSMIRYLKDFISPTRKHKND